MNAPVELTRVVSERRAWIVLWDEQVRSRLAGELAPQGWLEVRTFPNPSEALQALRASDEPPDLVVTGLYFEVSDGFDLMRELAELRPAPAVYLLSHQQRAVIRAAVSLARERGLRVAGYADFPVSAMSVAQSLAHYPLQRRAVDREMDSLPLERAELQAMVDARKIVAFMQPKVNLGSGEVVGFEALMRGLGPNDAIIAPDRLIAPLSANGLLADATVLVFEETVEFLGQCLQEGFPVSASVNAPLGLISDPSFCRLLIDRVERRGIDPSWITVEITETEAMSDLATVTERTARIRMMGFNLSIDDFGSAYSSFMQLSQLPFSELKIERSFVTSLHVDPVKQAIVSACATLGTRLGLHVVAEGVESPLELRAVRSLGCTEAQGFLVARPVPPQKARNWLRACEGIAQAACAELSPD